MIPLLASSASAAIITLPYTYTNGLPLDASQLNNDFNTIYNDYNGNITNANIANNAAITLSKLGSGYAFNTVSTGNPTWAAGVTGDTQPRIRLMSQGSLQFGPGGGTTPDISLKRINSTTLGIYDAATESTLENLQIQGLTLGTQLSVPNGGTGATTFTANSFLIGNGTSPVSTLTGTSNQIPGMNNAANGVEMKTITAGSGIVIANSANTITISAGTPSGFARTTNPARVVYEGYPVSYSSSTFDGGSGYTATFTQVANTAIAQPITNDGHYVQLITSAVNGNEAKEANTAIFKTGLLPSFVWKVRIPTSLTAKRVWACMTDSDPGGVDTNNGYNLLGFRYSTSAGDTKWQCVTSNGTTMTVVDSGVTVVADTPYILAVDASTAGQAIFYINGTAVLTTSTTLPLTTTAIGPYATVTTLTTATTSLEVAKFYGEQF